MEPGVRGEGGRASGGSVGLNIAHAEAGGAWGTEGSGGPGGAGGCRVCGRASDDDATGIRRGSHCNVPHVAAKLTLSVSSRTPATPFLSCRFKAFARFFFPFFYVSVKEPKKYSRTVK